MRLFVVVCLWLTAVCAATQPTTSLIRSTEARTPSDCTKDSVPVSTLALLASPMKAITSDDIGLSNLRELLNPKKVKQFLDIPVPEPDGSWFAFVHDSLVHVLDLVSTAIEAHIFDPTEFGSTYHFEQTLRSTNMSTPPPPPRPPTTPRPPSTPRPPPGPPPGAPSPAPSRQGQTVSFGTTTPAPPPRPPTTVVRTPNRHFGGDSLDGVKWTGGKTRGSPMKTGKTPFARRPEGDRELMTVYREATKPLPEKERFDGFGQGKIPFGKWARYVEMHLERCGMDGVFYVPVVGGGHELLTRCHGKTTITAVLNHVNSLTDQYDCDNLTWSAAFITGSISRGQNDLLYRYGTMMSGPEVFMRLAVSSHSGHLVLERSAIQQLNEARLRNVPGESVPEFTKVFLELLDIVQYGQLGAPGDIKTVYVHALSECTNARFATAMHSIYNDLMTDMNKFSVHEITSLAETRYNDLLARGLWLEGAARPGAAVGFAALQHTGAGATKKNVYCYICGDPGHIAPNCPHRGKLNKGNGNNNNNTSTTQQNNKQKSWRREKPKEGQPQQLTKNGATFYWCDKCRLWNKTHSTDKHVSKKKSYAAAATTTSPADADVANICGLMMNLDGLPGAGSDE